MSAGVGVEDCMLTLFKTASGSDPAQCRSCRNGGEKVSVPLAGSCSAPAVAVPSAICLRRKRDTALHGRDGFDRCRYRLPLGSVVEAGGRRYQRDERTKDHAELLDFADEDDAEYHPASSAMIRSANNAMSRYAILWRALVFQRPSCHPQAPGRLAAAGGSAAEVAAGGRGRTHHTSGLHPARSGRTRTGRSAPVRWARAGLSTIPAAFAGSASRSPGVSAMQSARYGSARRNACQKSPCGNARFGSADQCRASSSPSTRCSRYHKETLIVSGSPCGT